jgi:hypothetical protein
MDFCFQHLQQQAKRTEDKKELGTTTHDAPHYNGLPPRPHKCHWRQLFAWGAWGKDGLRALESWHLFASVDGLSVDGLSVDGLSVDGLSVDGLSVDGLSVDGLSVDGLSRQPVMICVRI